jgi:hypothetical protein
VKRLHFIFSMVATAAYGLARGFRFTVAAMSDPKPRTWAEHVAESGRRFEHVIHMRYCHGEYDHLKSPEEAAKRRARCAAICGFCRYTSPHPIWPNPRYRRPPLGVLEALENEPYRESSRGHRRA